MTQSIVFSIHRGVDARRSVVATTAVLSAAERSYPTSKVRGSGRMELPHTPGKEQQLRLAGAAVKRYPTSKVRETQVRQ